MFMLWSNDNLLLMVHELFLKNDMQLMFSLSASKNFEDFGRMSAGLFVFEFYQSIPNLSNAI